MMTPQEKLTQLLEQFSQKTGFDLPLTNNTCTLAGNTGDTAVIIELPEESDLLLLHRMLIQWPASAEIRNARAMQLLALNGEPEKLQGAWFCTDPEGFGIHLMTGCNIDYLNDNDFENLIINFVDLANTLVQEFNEEEQPFVVNNPILPGIQP